MSVCVRALVLFLLFFFWLIGGLILVCIRFLCSNEVGIYLVDKCYAMTKQVVNQDPTHAITSGANGIFHGISEFALSLLSWFPLKI